MVWHHSLQLMNSFNKTEAAVFSCRLCFLGTFHFISLMYQTHQLSIENKEYWHSALYFTHKSCFLVLSNNLLELSIVHALTYIFPQEKLRCEQVEYYIALFGSSNYPFQVIKCMRCKQIMYDHFGVKLIPLY